MDCESTFRKVTGRPPTSEEAAQLSRLLDSWNLRGNEAAAALLFVIHFSSSDYPDYPSRFAISGRRALGTRRGSPSIQSHRPHSFGHFPLLIAAIACTTAVGILSFVLATSETIRWQLSPNLLAVATTQCDWAMLLVLLPSLAYGTMTLSQLIEPATEASTRA